MTVESPIRPRRSAPLPARPLLLASLWPATLSASHQTLSNAKVPVPLVVLVRLTKTVVGGGAVTGTDRHDEQLRIDSYNTIRDGK